MRYSDRKPQLRITTKEKAILGEALELPVLEYELLIMAGCKELEAEWLPDSLEHKNGVVIQRSTNYIKIHAGLRFSGLFYVYCNWACRFWISRSFQHTAEIIAAEKKVSAYEIHNLNEMNRLVSLEKAARQRLKIPGGLAEIKWEHLS
jgi:hypothetical protein